MQNVQKAKIGGGQALKKDILSTGDVAAACHVTKHTIISAIEKGELRASRTPGGHNRIRREDAIVFMRKHNLLPEAAQVVVVVDAEGFVAEILEQVLSGDGCDILLAQNAYEAGRLVERARPNLIVADVGMAGLDLPSLYRHVQDGSFGRQCWVLAIGALDADEEEGKSAPHLPAERLVKPFAVEELRSKVERLLRNGH